MGVDVEPHASRRSLIASAAAPRPPQIRVEDVNHQNHPPQLGWATLLDTLKTLEGALKQKKEEDLARTAERAHDIARGLWKDPNRGGTATETRLDRIEGQMGEVLKAIKDKAHTAPQKSATWAAIAAGAGSGTTEVRSSAKPARATIRVRIADTQDMPPGQLLETAKKHIPAAFAVRPLRSGDVDIYVPDQAEKDRVLNQPESEGIKILRQNYIIEIPSVPLTLGVSCCKGADNNTIIKDICDGSKKLVPGIAIDNIQWLHSPEAQSRRNGATNAKAKTRGTILIAVPTQAIQTKIIQKGIIIDSQLFDTRLFDHSLRIKQCFRCQEWGHTQSACGKTSRCGQCAAPHTTRDCPKERVSCVNCGKKHRAWQRASCPTYQIYYNRIQAKRAIMYVESGRVRAIEAQTPTQALQNHLQNHQFQFVQNKKRPRQPTPIGQTEQPTPKRAIGRPSTSAVLATTSRDSSQTILLSSVFAPAKGRETTLAVAAAIPLPTITTTKKAPI
jgi:hypothetical protein